jgi:hypothetical protein
VVAIPNEPSERGLAAGARPAPSFPVHHRKPPPKNMNPREASLFKDWRTPCAFQEGQSKHYDDTRTEFERVCDKLIRDVKRRIRHDRFDAVWHLVDRQEVTLEMQREVIRDQVARDDGMARITQDSNERVALGIGPTIAPSEEDAGPHGRTVAGLVGPGKKT